MALTRASWEQIDATTAFLNSYWLSPAQARRAFGDQLSALPPQAFAGRELTRAVGKLGPRISRARG